MIRIPQEIWEELLASQPSGARLNAKLATPTITQRLYCALDSENQRHLLIPLNEDEAELEDRQTRGLYVITRELAIHGEPLKLYLDLVCRDSMGYDAFDVIGGEIAEMLGESRRRPAEIIRLILTKWRRFWGQVPLDILSRPEVLGLFGELWFLSRWLVPRIGIAEAVRCWNGPCGSRHDFERSNGSVEVKTTTSSRGRVFHIHGLEQLEPPESGDLSLFGLSVREEAGASNTLPSIIMDIRAQIETDVESLIRFDKALIKARYSPIHDEHYENIRFRIVEEALFSVSDDFPRITRSSIAAGSLNGIENVEYEINLSGYDRLIIARSPNEGSWI